MITPITYPTAIDYWLKTANSKDYPVSFSEIIRQKSFLSCRKEDILRDANIFHLKEPLHILFPDGRSRHMAEQFKCHVIDRNIPPDSFIRLTDHLYIICPELTFLMAANHLSLPQLIRLGDDLCSIYRRDVFSKYGQSKRRQVTTAADIRDYLSQAHKVSGLEKARQAANYILDCSNSPVESKTAAFFHLPMVLGGTGINGLSLNHDYTLGKQAATFLGRDTCCVDAAYVSGRKGFEYDSDLVHLTPDQIDYDKKRLTALQMSGYSIFTISKKHLSTAEEIEKLMLSARSFLGLRTRMDRFEKYHYKRLEVINDLFLSKKDIFE